jgi:hypothetical protein
VALAAHIGVGLASRAAPDAPPASTRRGVRRPGAVRRRTLQPTTLICTRRALAVSVFGRLTRSTPSR